MRSAVKAAPARPRKSVPANRGYGQPGKAKHDPGKHPRGPDGRFITSGGSAKPKTPRTRKAAAPKPPKKVGTPKQRKGLADQIRAARKAAKTPTERKALLGAVRDLRAKRAQWQRGQGKTQVEKLPKPEKPKKEAAPKAPKPKKESKPVREKKTGGAKVEKGSKKAGAARETNAGVDQVVKRSQALHARLERAGAKTLEEKMLLIGERLQQSRELQGQRAAIRRVKAEGKKGKGARGDLKAHAEGLLGKPPREQGAKLRAFIDRHKTAAVEVKRHGMAVAEPMHSVKFGEHTLHFPGTEAGHLAAAQTARDLILGNQVHPEVSRHTRDIYLTSQASVHDGHWKKAYNNENHVSTATGGDGAIVVYHGAPLGGQTYAHEAGHNLATARYGSTSPRATGDYAKAVASGEKPPTDYATKSPAEDFAESVRVYTHDNAAFARSNPLRYRAVKRLLEDPTHGG